jgi:hypothetical protein
LLTTLYAYGDAFEHAKRWIRAGLLSDPNDQGLLINLAFVQARMGHVAEAQGTIRRLRALRTVTAEPFLRATEGLLQYQCGQFEGGDRLYEEAVDLLEKSQRAGVAAYCRLNQALFAIEYQHPRASDLVAKANAATIAHPTVDASMLLRVRTDTGLEAPAEQQVALRRTSQWVFDPSTNTLNERLGLTPVGAKPLVILDRKPR